MALTNYKCYRWLVETLENAPAGGYSLDELAKLYDVFRRKEERAYRTGVGKMTRVKGVVSLKRTTFFNWRVQVWVQFGLTILNPRQDNLYVLANPELLDEDRTLRRWIDFLCESEQRGYETETLVFSKRGRKPGRGVISSELRGYEVMPSGTSSEMFGFQTTGGAGDNNLITSKLRTQNSLMAVRFSMETGEALVIGRNSPEVFCPAWIGELNGRWYVAGDVYPIDEPDKRLSKIFDVSLLRLYEGDGAVSPHYEVPDEFNPTSLLPEDWKEHLPEGRVVSLYIRCLGTFLDDVPIYPTQTRVEELCSLTTTVYRLYAKLDEGFLLSLMSYGRKLLVWGPYWKVERGELDISDDEISYLRALQMGKL